MDKMLERVLPQINNVSSEKIKNVIKSMSAEDIPRIVYDSLPKLCVDKKINILICSTGSVATIKLPELLMKLCKSIQNLNPSVIMTERAKHFCTLESLQAESPVNVYSDSDREKWAIEKSKILSEELVRWADMLLIAPLDANTLAKIANGICDNLVTSIVRCWDFNHKIAVCCPAMNTQMWIHPITSIQMKQLETLGFDVIPPIVKKLMCGDYGVGAMAELDTIIVTVQRYADFGGNRLLCHHSMENDTKELSTKEVTSSK